VTGVRIAYFALECGGPDMPALESILIRRLWFRGYFTAIRRNLVVMYQCHVVAERV
jgi:hypothetical protein